METEEASANEEARNSARGEEEAYRLFEEMMGVREEKIGGREERKWRGRCSERL